MGNTMTDKERALLEKLFIQMKIIDFETERKKFQDETKHSDIVMTTLRVHMYIEKELIELMSIYLKTINDFDNLNFKMRLNILFAMGVIDQELYDPIKCINDIRNKFSHSLDEKFTEVTYKKLKNSLSNNLLREYKRDIEHYKNFVEKDLDHIEMTRILLSCVWVNIRSEVSASIFRKEQIANDYERQVQDELLAFKKANFLFNDSL